MASAEINLAQVQQQVSEAVRANNRSDDCVTLLAVSKTKPVSAIEDFIELGVLDFGENYLQEAIEKITTINNDAVNWHFIGAIQSRKCKQIASHFHWVHTVDRPKVAVKLNQHAPQPINICIQVNIDRELSKAGIFPEQLAPLIAEIKDLDNLVIRGLMVIPSKEHLNSSPNAFERAQTLLATTKRQFPELPLDYLSMGMSGDLQEAIAAGSNCVRIGTALFGARDVK